MTQNEELDKVFFVTFCMEQYKHEHNMTGKEVADLFSQQGALTYLEENFEILHTKPPVTDGGNQPSRRYIYESGSDR